MRKPLIAANWKMNKSLADVASYFATFIEESKWNETSKRVDTLFGAPFTLLQEAVKVTANKGLPIASQNVHFENSGAFTGEISPAMVKETGATYCIVGHSERRQYFNESDEMIAKKVAACMAHGLRPVLCVGETKEQRQEGITEEVIQKQLEAVFGTNTKFEGGVIAYEPVWAIGTGLSASAEEAEEVHAFIRRLVAKLLSPQLSNSARILYGGSVNVDNLASFLSKPNIDGALVGGASLNPSTFAKMIVTGGQQGKLT
jgi:triosephosphate isomerase